MKKTALITDLHKILFGTLLESCPDNFDVLVSMAEGFISHHGLFFKDKDEVSDSCYWGEGVDVSDYFFDKVCPGIVPSVTQFECVCNDFFDFDMWEMKQPVIAIFDGLLDAVSAIAKTYHVTDVAERKDNITLVTPTFKAA